MLPTTFIRFPTSSLLLFVLLQLLATFRHIDAAVGVCYGTRGDNLPSVERVISLYQKYNISLMRIYYPDPAVLRALQGTNIQLSLDIPSPNIPTLAASQASADKYICRNIKPYIRGLKLRYITVGNEVEPGQPEFELLVPAIENVQRSMYSIGLNNTKVSTCFKYNLKTAFPPSAGAFSTEYESVLRPLVKVLKANGAPYMINVYPFFAYQNDPKGVGRDFTLFLLEQPVLKDGEYMYSNLFDASVDAVYSALERYDAASVKVLVSETGWATVGKNNEVTNVENAWLYNNNLVKHVYKGTPKRPGEEIEAYIFEMFNENEKPAGVESNFGLFYPDEKPLYHVAFPPMSL
ncbi:Glucan endo-1,3-beta-glucosidase [Linum grandiflorum]